MKQFIGLIVFLAIAAGILKLVQIFLSRPNAPAGFEKRESVLSDAERAFFYALRRAVPEGYFIFANIRLIDVIRVAGKSRADFVSANQIRQKHLDFVVCEPSRLAPVIAIELDGKTHQSQRQIRRDAVKDAALKSAQLPLVRFPAKGAGYSIDEIRRRLPSLLLPLNK